MKLRYVPNAITTARIILCVPLVILPLLFSFEVFSLAYMLIFFVAGVTDMIDGPIARRVKGGSSELGATLDSIADVLLVCVGVFVIVPQMEMWGWIRWSYVCLLLIKIIVSTSIGFVRFKEFVSLHTISFKVLVIALFSLPLLYYFVRESPVINIYATAIFVYAILVVAEEILIISLTKKPERNLKSIFGVRAANRAVTEKALQEQI